MISGEQIATFIGAALGLLGIIAGAGKWLISSWYEKTQQLEELKHGKLQSHVERVEKSAEDIDRRVSFLSVKIDDLDKRMVLHDARIVSMTHEMERFRESTAPLVAALQRRASKPLEPVKDLGGGKQVYKTGTGRKPGEGEEG